MTEALSPLLPGALYLSEWIIRLVMLPIAVRRRRPSSAMAWLLVIFLIPWLGLVMYLLIGRQRLGRRRIDRAAAAHREIVVSTRDLVRLGSHVVHPKINHSQRDLVSVAEHIGDSPILGGNALEGYHDTGRVIDGIVSDIEGAERHVHVLMYIFENDATGGRVGEALIAAAARGVACRVLVDAVGSKAMLSGLAPRLRRAGVEVWAMLPVNPVRLLLSRLDIRNHRKLVVIDGLTAWAGSQNIVDADYGQRRIGAAQDVMLRLRGPAVLAVQEVFLEDWYAETGRLLSGEDLLPPPDTAGGFAVQVVPSGPHLVNRPLQDLYLAAIQEAERRLVITSPYFVPDEPVMAALRVAVMRGVRVDLIVPLKTDSFLINAAAGAYYRDLADAGVLIHQHRIGLLHAKTMTVDDTFAMIGSSNFDVRSFDINFELNLLMYGPEVTWRVRSLQERYIAQSTALTRERAHATGRVRRFGENFARLFSPLL